PLREPLSTHLPYTTLFRSAAGAVFRERRGPFPLRIGRDRGGRGRAVLGVARAAAHLPGSPAWAGRLCLAGRAVKAGRRDAGRVRSEEHTSELQSRENLVCR